jgi:polar amino acid transport system ATP-binding protein
VSVLEVKNLKKCFGSSVVIEDISFSLEKGESLAIIGSSGSGKTTLLRCLNFLEIPDGGTIKVGSETIFDGNNSSPLSDKEIRKRRLHFEATEKHLVFH